MLIGTNVVRRNRHRGPEDASSPFTDAQTTTTISTVSRYPVRDNGPCRGVHHSLEHPLDSPAPILVWVGTTTRCSTRWTSNLVDGRRGPWTNLRVRPGLASADPIRNQSIITSFSFSPSLPPAAFLRTNHPTRRDRGNPASGVQVAFGEFDWKIKRAARTLVFVVSVLFIVVLEWEERWIEVHGSSCH